jgi:hypothetical protein
MTGAGAVEDAETWYRWGQQEQIAHDAMRSRLAQAIEWVDPEKELGTLYILEWIRDGHE